MIAHLALMQGRLVPPEDDRIQCFPARGWREEFTRAAALGIHAIEWIYEQFGAAMNPFARREAWKEVQTLSVRFGVGVHSVCADILMDDPIVQQAPNVAEPAARAVDWLMKRAAESGIERLVLPFVGANALRKSTDIDPTLPYLTRWGEHAERLGFEVHLETALAPADMKALLAGLASPAIRVTYDIGNSIQFGYRADKELAAYGDRIGSVHVKDATWRGTTVPLGTGEADWSYCFQSLLELGFSGTFVLQAARVSGEDERETVTRDLAFVRGQLGAAGWEINGHGPRG